MILRGGYFHNVKPRFLHTAYNEQYSHRPFLEDTYAAETAGLRIVRKYCKNHG